MMRRVITTAPRATRALSTSVRPVLCTPARISAPAASQIAKRNYHEKDKSQNLYNRPNLPASHPAPPILRTLGPIPNHPSPPSKSHSTNTLKLLDHYSSPRNVGSMDKSSQDVGTGLVGAPACGDVMKLQIKVDPASNTISDVKFKTFGCGSAIASSSYLTELVRGMTLEDAGKVRNTEIARELCLPPVKLHCSMLAEDAIKSAIANYNTKNPKATQTNLAGTGSTMPKVEVETVMDGGAQPAAAAA